MAQEHRLPARQESTADGRSDGGTAAVLQFRHVRSVGTEGMLEKDPAIPSRPDIGLEELIRTGDKQDMEELTRLTYLADAVIDLDAGKREHLSSWVDPLDQRESRPSFKSGVNVYAKIVRRLMELIDRRTESGKSDDEPGAEARRALRGRDLPYAIDLLLETIATVPEPEPGVGASYMRRWVAIVACLERQLGALGEGISHDLQRRYALTQRELARTRVLVANAILWSIHNRLGRVRRAGWLGPTGEMLRARTRELLRMRHHDQLRRLHDRH